MATDLLSVAEKYFDCMRAGDLAVVDLFHEHAEIKGVGREVRGREEIRDFYQTIIASSSPSPTVIEPKLISGNRVFAEIKIHFSDDTYGHAIDVFEIEGERIKSLTIFKAQI